jgi:hypothetical protein
MAHARALASCALGGVMGAALAVGVLRWPLDRSPAFDQECGRIARARHSSIGRYSVDIDLLLAVRSRGLLTLVGWLERGDAERPRGSWREVDQARRVMLDDLRESVLTLELLESDRFRLEIHLPDLRLSEHERSAARARHWMDATMEGYWACVDGCIRLSPTSGTRNGGGMAFLAHDSVLCEPIVGGLLIASRGMLHEIDGLVPMILRRVSSQSR